MLVGWEFGAMCCPPIFKINHSVPEKSCTPDLVYIYCRHLWEWIYNFSGRLCCSKSECWKPPNFLLS